MPTKGRLRQIFCGEPRDDISGAYPLARSARLGARAAERAAVLRPEVAVRT